MRISDWSSDVCSSDLHVGLIEGQQVRGRTLERYLTALLQRAEEFEPGQAVILNGKFTSGDGKELSESSEITIAAVPNAGVEGIRSEEHTSELQSLMRISYAVFCLKQKNHTNN